MKKNIIASVLAVIALSSLAKAEEGTRNYYTCQYDGGQDAYTWQLTGQEVPPPGAARCLTADGPQYCLEVVDAKGNKLGNGRWCGDENGDSPYLSVKAYAQ
jgi:hypothetical protein